MSVVGEGDWPPTWAPETNREVAQFYSIGLFNCFTGASDSAIPEERIAILR
jgi:hypothetical protein